MNTNNHDLKGKKIAILATDGYEQVELTEPKDNLEEAGAKVEVLSIHDGKIKGWNKTDWGSTVKVDCLVNAAKPGDYDALVLPGGVMNPDHLRTNKAAVAFVRDFAQSGKPVAAICHGPQVLIEAGVVEGRTMTSYPSLRTDLENAGANWVDRQVVNDGNLVTSRKPEDIPAFCNTLTTMIAQSVPLARAS
jgi:protease I